MNILSLIKAKQQTKKEIEDYIKNNPQVFDLSEEQISKSMFPEKSCEICERKGCDVYLTNIGMKGYFHRKCYDIVRDITFKHFKK